ncbi:MAG: hypothetical protein CMJ83_14270 [Planctomycetes bacterium]|nr:hypothetical protein [Planctomycetota bacterium]
MTRNVFAATRMGALSLGAAVLLLATGCGLNGPTSTFPELGQDGNTRGFGGKFPQDPNESAFTFGVGDSLILLVQDVPEFSGTHVVRSDGRITVPLVNDVLAAGLTSSGLASKIEARLAIYVVEPQVTVSVGAVVSKAYYVAGQDLQTGSTLIERVPYPGDTTLFQAFVAMGAPSSILSDDYHVKVIRGDPRHPVVYTINVKEIYEEGFTGGNIQIRPDDIIYVPPTLLGHFNRIIAGISLPFESLFRISRSIVELDTTIRIIQGDDIYSRGSRY